MWFVRFMCNIFLFIEKQTSNTFIHSWAVEKRNKWIGIMYMRYLEKKSGTGDSRNAHSMKTHKNI